jgi:class 3 adenylate cyclase/tetratricopeptide (TPR) repeat protein
MAVCPSCSVVNDSDARFCKGCGHALTASAPQRRRLATSVFCDLSGSTALAERVDAEVLFGLMARYFEDARSALEHHGGLVEKFIGDAVVGIFGVPEAHEDDALRACRAALDIQARVARLNADYEQTFETGIAVRIGVNTGEVVSGAVGRGGMFATADAVVLGDAVNVAARLEQAAPPGEVLIGESTYRLVRASARLEEVPPIEAKGKSEPLVAYRLLGLTMPGKARVQPRAPLTGRERELAVLEQAFRDIARERSCRLVTVVGEPGVGKSRLAAELIDRIGTEARTVRGGCLSYGEGITYWAISEIVRDLGGIRDDHSPESARTQLDRTLAGSADAHEVSAQLARLLGLAAEATTSEELAWAVRRFLAVAAADHPLVLVLDDIQWAEHIVLDLLSSLPRTLPGSPILILCLARPELRERAPDWDVTLRLEGLTAADVEELLERLGAAAPLRSRLARVTAGNPLFAEELVAMLADEGVLAKLDLDMVELPIGLNAILNARLDRLRGDARAALERGAIEGEVFHRGAVVDLSAPEARSEIPSLLEELGERDFVHVTSSSFTGDAAFRFKHLLVREAAYRATPKKLRAALHEAFADWLTRVSGDRVHEFEEILGYHLEQAYQFRTELGPTGHAERELGDRAAAHFVSAARRAAGRSDFDAAASLIRRALELGIADPRQRLRAQFELGHALHQTRHVAEAEAVLTETGERAAQLGELDVAALAFVQRAWNRTGDPSSEFRLDHARLEQAIEALRSVGDDRGLVLARRLRGVRLAGSDPVRAGAELEETYGHAVASGDREMLRLAIGSLANAHLYEGPTPAPIAIERCEQILASVRGDRVLEATVKRPLAVFYAMVERADEAIRLAGEAADVLNELNLRTAHVYRRVGAYALELAGDSEGAEAELNEIWAYFRALRPEVVDTRAQTAIIELARLYCDQERWDEATAILPYVHGTAQTPLRVSRGIAVEARLAGHRRRPEALALAEEALARSERRSGDLTTRALMWSALAEVQRSAGRKSEADGSLKQALELYKLKGNIAAARLTASAGGVD